MVHVGTHEDRVQEPDRVQRVPDADDAHDLEDDLQRRGRWQRDDRVRRVHEDGSRSQVPTGRRVLPQRRAKCPTDVGSKTEPLRRGLVEEPMACGLHTTYSGSTAMLALRSAATMSAALALRAPC